MSEPIMVGPKQPEGQEYDLDSIELDESEAEYEVDETNAKEEL